MTIAAAGQPETRHQSLEPRGIPSTSIDRLVSSSARHHVPALDGLRGIAILLVIAHHAGIAENGWVGVDLFFALSGFLITGILVRAKDRPHYYRNFLARRALRIFPVCYAYLVAVLLLEPALHHLPLPTGQWPVWAYLTNVAVSLHGWDSVPFPAEHLWSVAVEEQFYLLWPAVVLACSPSRLRRMCAGGIVVALALRIALTYRDATWVANYVLMPTRMDALLLGAAVAITPRLLDVRRALWIGAIGLLASVWILRSGGRDDAWVETLGYSAIAVTATAAIVLALGVPGFARIVSWRPLRLAGKYSYAAYLGHRVVMDAIRSRLLLTGWPLALAATAVTFACAAVSWQLFEAPILSLKRFFPEPDVAPPTGHLTGANGVATSLSVTEPKGSAT